ncbi:MAG: hypothetical protein NDI82_10650 [Anaeromyxobacteraceae bacterium]|nr:hypothetical protein [Anaeromyxobacteraceae bacterium]
MCHFINIVLPARVDIEPLREIAKRHGRVLSPNTERLVCDVLGPDERAYLTSSMCDCGTQLAIRRSARREHDEDREVVRLRKAGWSETKIQRWREQRGTAAEQKAKTKAKSREHESEVWRALLTDLLDAKPEHVGLLVHWVTDEVRRGPTLPRSGLATDAMGNLEENVLYTFTRRQ